MRKYVFQADLVRAIAILAVIGVHIVITITPRPDFFGGTVWWISFLLNCLFRISVPLFVILSGYLTLGSFRHFKDNLKRVSFRLLIPLLIYYVIFTFVYVYMAYLRAEEYDYAGIFHNLSKNTHTSLYFLVILLFIQLLNPLWDLLTEEKNRQVLKYVCFFFLALGVISNIFYYVSLRREETFSTFTYWLMWVGYYLYGFVVKTKSEFLSRKETLFYSIMFIFGFLFTITSGYLILWLFHHGINDAFYIGGQAYADGYLSFNVMLMSISSFNLLVRSKKIADLVSLGWFRNVVVFISGISFALYLIHLLVIDTLSKFFGVNPDSPSMPNLAGFLVIIFLLAFLISIPIAFAITNTPYLRKTVGKE